MGILTLAVVLWLDEGQALLAAAGLIPTPPPVETMVPGATPSASAVANSTGLQPAAPYIINNPSLASYVLHWTQSSFNFSLQSRDMANGQSVIGEIWERLDASGLPAIFHGYYTLVDGSFYQEIIQSRSAIIVVRRTNALPNSEMRPDSCVQRGSTPAAAMQSVLPTFIASGLLDRNGFKQSGGLTGRLPTPRPYGQVKPTRVYGSDANTQGWEAREVDNAGVSHLLRLEISSDGRLLFDQVRTLDPKGDVVNERWTANGPLELYSADTIPDSVFAQIQESCHE